MPNWNSRNHAPEHVFVDASGLGPNHFAYDLTPGHGLIATSSSGAMFQSLDDRYQLSGFVSGTVVGNAKVVVRDKTNLTWGRDDGFSTDTYLYATGSSAAGVTYKEGYIVLRNGSITALSWSARNVGVAIGETDSIQLRIVKNGSIIANSPSVAIPTIAGANPSISNIDYFNTTTHTVASGDYLAIQCNVGNDTNNVDDILATLEISTPFTYSISGIPVVPSGLNSFSGLNNVQSDSWTSGDLAGFNGANWVPASNIESTIDNTHLRLDAANDPVTGALTLNDEFHHEPTGKKPAFFGGGLAGNYAGLVINSTSPWNGGPGAKTGGFISTNTAWVDAWSGIDSAEPSGLFMRMAARRFQIRFGDANWAGAGATHDQPGTPFLTVDPDTEYKVTVPTLLSSGNINALGVLQYQGQDTDERYALSGAPHTLLGSSHSDTTGSPVSGHILGFDGTNWRPTVDSGVGGAGSSTLGGLTDTTLGTLTSGHFLNYNGSAWVNASYFLQPSGYQVPSGDYATVGQGHILWQASGLYAVSGDYATVTQGHMLWKSASDFFQPSGYQVPSGDYATVTQGHILWLTQGEGDTLYKSSSDFFQPSGYQVPSGDYATVTQGYNLWMASGIFETSGQSATTIANHVALSDPHTQYLTESAAATTYQQSGIFEASGLTATVITNHVALSDPHTQYLTSTEADTAYMASGIFEASGLSATVVVNHVALSDPHTQYLTEAVAPTLYAASGNLAPSGNYATVTQGHELWQASGTTSLLTLTDTLVTSATSGQQMNYDGSTWINEAEKHLRLDATNDPIIADLAISGNEDTDGGLTIYGWNRPAVEFGKSNSDKIVSWSIVAGSNDNLHFKPDARHTTPNDDDANLSIASGVGIGVNKKVPAIAVDVVGDIAATGDVSGLTVGAATLNYQGQDTDTRYLLSGSATLNSLANTLVDPAVSGDAITYDGTNWVPGMSTGPTLPFPAPSGHQWFILVSGIGFADELYLSMKKSNDSWAYTFIREA